MQFWYCENCGNRLTEKDLEEGRAANKQLRGVYCKTCATGVMTMEFDALTVENARGLLRKAQHKQEQASAAAAETRKKAETRSSKSARRAGMLVYVAAFGGTALAVVGVALLLRSGEAPSAAQTRKGEAASATGEPAVVPLPALETPPKKHDPRPEAKLPVGARDTESKEQPRDATPSAGSAIQTPAVQLPEAVAAVEDKDRQEREARERAAHEEREKAKLKEQQEARDRQARERTERTREQLFAALDEQLKRDDPAGLLARVSALEQEEHGAPELKAARVLGEALAERHKLAREFVAKNKGKELTVRSGSGVRKGVVTEVSDQQIRLEARIIINGEVKGMNRHEVAWGDMPRAQIDALSKDWKPEQTERALARLLSVLSDPDSHKNKKLADELEADLALAKDSPLAPHFRRKIETLRLGAAEVAAKEAWHRIEREAANLDPPRAKALLAQVDGYFKEHGQSRFARENTAKLIADLRRASCVNLVKNGDFESGSTAPWKFEGGAGSVDTTQAHDGKAALRVEGRATWTQQIEAEPGHEYVIIFWLKVIERSDELYISFLEEGQSKTDDELGVDVKREHDWRCYSHVFRLSKPNGRVQFFGKSLKIALDGVEVSSLEDRNAGVRRMFARAPAGALPAPDGKVLLGPGATEACKLAQGFDSLEDGPNGVPGFNGSAPLLVLSPAEMGTTSVTPLTFVYTAAQPVEVLVRGRTKQFGFCGDKITLPAGRMVTHSVPIPHRGFTRGFDQLQVWFSNLAPNTFWLYRITAKL